MEEIYIHLRNQDFNRKITLKDFQIQNKGIQKKIIRILKISDKLCNVNFELTIISNL